MKSRTTVKPLPRRLACLVAIQLVVAASAPLTVAGEADHEPDDTHEFGAAYFGEAKLIPSLEHVPDVRVRGLIKGTTRFFITTTDDHGRFRRQGMGLDVDADQMVFTCEKTGFRTIEVMSKRLSKAKDAPVEVECLMVKE
jgi:hypothetical protein